MKETFSGGIFLNGGSLEIGGNKGGLAAIRCRSTPAACSAAMA